LDDDAEGRIPQALDDQVGEQARRNPVDAAPDALVVDQAVHGFVPSSGRMMPAGCSLIDRAMAISSSGVSVPVTRTKRRPSCGSAATSLADADRSSCPLPR